MISNQTISEAMTIKLPEVLPDMPVFQEGIRRAPDRGFRLSEAQTKLALKKRVEICTRKIP